MTKKKKTLQKKDILKKKKATKKKQKIVKITFDQQMKAFIDVVVANRKYYWIYRPHSWMVKDGDSPRFLGDVLLDVLIVVIIFIENYTREKEYT